jgi:hypothetical protein
MTGSVCVLYMSEINLIVLPFMLFDFWPKKVGKSGVL